MSMWRDVLVRFVPRGTLSQGLSLWLMRMPKCQWPFFISYPYPYLFSLLSLFSSPSPLSSSSFHPSLSLPLLPFSLFPPQHSIPQLGHLKRHTSFRFFSLPPTIISPLSPSSSTPSLPPSRPSCPLSSFPPLPPPAIRGASPSSSHLVTFAQGFGL